MNMLGTKGFYNLTVFCKLVLKYRVLEIFLLFVSTLSKFEEQNNSTGLLMTCPYRQYKVNVNLTEFFNFEKLSNHLLFYWPTT